MWLGKALRVRIMLISQIAWMSSGRLGLSKILFILVSATLMRVRITFKALTDFH